MQSPPQLLFCGILGPHWRAVGVKFICSAQQMKRQGITQTVRLKTHLPSVTKVWFAAIKVIRELSWVVSNAFCIVIMLKYSLCLELMDLHPTHCDLRAK